ncbi:MAG: hypothetical protein H0W83_16820 [Planctomycetes bacterium]|nr:hypothetical protein [Planctomycetota bacterium]
MAAPSDEELFKVIDAEAANPREGTDSRLIYRALSERRDRLGAASDLPQDKALSEKILAEARSRSAQISASRKVSGPVAVVTPGIPWWLWLGWIVAIAAVVAAFRYLV